MSDPKVELITLNKADLAAMIADAVAAERANQAPMFDSQGLADAISQGMAANTRRKVTFGEYIQKRAIGRAHLTRACFQNGYHFEEENLSNEAMALLNQISHSGRYIDRKVEVIVREDGSEEVVELRYKNKTADDRFELRGLVRTLEDMLTQIVTAQTEERKANELSQETAKVRRSFGDTKAYREAKARAEA